MDTGTTLSDREIRRLDRSLVDALEANNIDSVQNIISKCQDQRYALNCSIYWATTRWNMDYINQVISNEDIDLSWAHPLYHGRTALHYAAQKGRKEVIQLLISNGADKDVTDEDGDTPLHYAAIRGEEEVLKLLIPNEASLNIKDNKGDTALDLAQTYNNQNCVDILQAAMSRQPEPLKVKPSENMSVQEQDDIVDNSKKPNQIAEDDKSTVTKKQEAPDAPITPEVEASLIEAIKEGYGDINLALILLHGAPAVGKSSLVQLLQRLPPLPKSQQHSTEVFQNPVRLINTDQFNLTGKNVLERVDERKVMRMIAAQITRQKTQSPLPVASNKTSSPGKVSTRQTDTVVVSDVVKGIAAELSKVNTHTANLFRHHLFHIVDSGGQPQFTDVLPLMFPKVSLHIVVIRLDEKLDDKPKIRYLVAGEDKCVLPKNLALSHLQMIERTCELAQAAAMKNRKDKPPRVVVVGTCLDCVCPEESLLQKNHRLEEVFERYKHIIVRKSSQEVIFAMNAMAPEGEERNEYTCVLQNIILNALPVHTSDVKVPARWMLLHLELSRLSEEGLLEMSTCIEVADRIQMRNDLPNALDYFTKVALHMRFPDKLPKLVFAKFNPIVSRLSTVLAATFTQPKFDPMEEERENLRVNGIVTKAFVHKLFEGKFKQNPFSVDDFFTLLEYLLIAVKIDDSEYFIPCVLPLEDPNPEDFPNKSEPILLTWNSKVLPQGFFPALIVQLLQRKNDLCFSHCAGEKQLRRAICLDTQYGALRIVDQTSWFELYFAGKMQYSQSMLEAVENSSFHLSNILNIHGFGELQRAFRCTGVCGSKDPVHPGVLTVTNECCCTKRRAYRFTLSSEQMYWISSSLDNDGEMEWLKISHDCADVFALIECHSAKWNEFGRALKVDLNTRESLRRDNRLDNGDRLEHVLEKWIESQCSPVTWEHVINMLSSMDLKKTASSVQDYLKRRQVMKTSSRVVTDAPPVAVKQANLDDNNTSSGVRARRKSSQDKKSTTGKPSSINTVSIVIAIFGFLLCIIVFLLLILISLHFLV